MLSKSAVLPQRYGPTIAATRGPDGSLVAIQSSPGCFFVRPGDFDPQSAITQKG
jgi:hypothetical protein